MGKAAITRATAKLKTAAHSTIQMKPKKKKGRPPLSDLQKRHTKSLSPSPNFPNSAPSRRSARRKSLNSRSGSSKFVNDDYDDDDDERKQKKVKLVVRLPQSTPGRLQHSSSSSQNSASASDSEPDDAEDRDDSPSRSPINAVDRRSSDVDMDQGQKGLKVTDNLHGSSLEAGPTTPLPDKELLVFILDRLQKKDTYGVFSEPVDPTELPDYLDIIEHPMDFGTVRKKLDAGSYSHLGELEADVLLICSNAMQYNAPDTVYFRQARSIQELAKRDFENLRHEGADGEPQPKVVRRGRPPSKKLKKPLESSPADCAGVELSSGATLASQEDKAVGSNAYNLRKGVTSYRFRSYDTFATNYHSRNVENYTECWVDWNSEFPASILRADMKYGKKHFSVDESKRGTYKQFHLSACGSEQPLLSLTSTGERLMAVGLHAEPHAYARSLARYAANLGPVAWKIASRKLKSVLSDEIAFGPGWVGENEAPAQQSSFAGAEQKLVNGFIHKHDSIRPATPVSGLCSDVAYRPSEEMAEPDERLKIPNELAEQSGVLSWTTPGSSFQAQQKRAFPCNRNGLSGTIGHDLSSQMGILRTAVPEGRSMLEDGSTVKPMRDILSRNEVSSINQGSWFQAAAKSKSHKGNLVSGVLGPLQDAEMGISSKHQQISMHHIKPLPVPPDLNVRVSGSGSPSSSLQIGSPRQPDLALQL